MTRRWHRVTWWSCPCGRHAYSDVFVQHMREDEPSDCCGQGPSRRHDSHQNPARFPAPRIMHWRDFDRGEIGAPVRLT